MILFQLKHFIDGSVVCESYFAFANILPSVITDEKKALILGSSN